MIRGKVRSEIKKPLDAVFGDDVGHVLHAILGMKNLSARWEPRLLTSDNQRNRENRATSVCCHRHGIYFSVGLKKFEHCWVKCGAMLKNVSSLFLNGRYFYVRSGIYRTTPVHYTYIVCECGSRNTNSSTQQRPAAPKPGQAGQPVCRLASTKCLRLAHGMCMGVCTMCSMWPNTK